VYDVPVPIHRDERITEAALRAGERGLRQRTVRHLLMQPERVLEQRGPGSGKPSPGRLAHRRTEDSILLVMARAFHRNPPTHKRFDARRGPARSAYS
jgi:hypothetical protein